MLSIDSRVSSHRLLEAASNKQQQQRRRQTSISSSQNSYQIDRLLEDDGNDWFFEKILEKFENIRAKNGNRHARPSSYDFDADDVSYDVERIIERRYYVRKPRLTSKRNQLTSTSDLTGDGRKHRQYSGVSSATAATTVCSRCSSSTPTYVENLREQSDALRNEISDLKNEIEHLQASQQGFFEQLQTHFQAKSETTTMPNFAPPIRSPRRSPLEKNNAFNNLPVSLSNGKKSRSISTRSHGSSSSSTSSEGSTTPERQSATKFHPTASRIPVAPVSSISEFIATKNPTIVPGPPTDVHISSESSSTTSVSSLSEQVSSKQPPIAPVLPTAVHISSGSSSSASMPPVTKQVSSQPPFMKLASPTDTNINSNSLSKPSALALSEQAGSKQSLVVSLPPIDGYISSESSSIAATPIITKQFDSKPSVRIPTPPTDASFSSNPSSIPTAPPFFEQISSKRPPMAPAPSADVPISSKPPSIGSTPPITGPVSSRPSSTTATPLSTGFPGLRNPLLVQTPPLSVPIGILNTRTSSIAPTPPIAPSLTPLTRAPIYENELAYRRVLSPRSQIIASSASLPDSSDSSSGSVSPEPALPNPRQIPKDSARPLHTTDLNALVRYSSQLELSGFPPSTTHIISNPNTSSTFWDSVDQYIASSGPTNIDFGLPPIPRSSNASRSTLYNPTTRQLDKYDLEIKPQGFIESSAPLLMPPLDISP